MILINTDLIDKYREKKGLTKTAFCRVCRISTQTPQRMYKGKKIGVEIAAKIARVLEIDITDLAKK